MAASEQEGLLKTSTWIAGVTLACLAAPALAAPAPTCPPDTPRETREVEAVVRDFYAEMAAGRDAAAARLTTPGFYAYEGKRLTAPELFQTLADARARGVVLAWSLGPMDVHLSCDMAWAAWENHGAAGPAGEMKPVTWLESVALRRQDGAWRIDFLHAHRAPAAAKP
jgi:hypothetical protein